MTDLYASYTALAAGQTENVDYERRVVPSSGTTWASIAIHGGAIEPGSGEIARYVAVNRMDHYEFAGIMAANNFDTLHVTSTNFNEPIATALVLASTRTLSFHGYTGDGTPVTSIGGLDTYTGARIRSALQRAGFTVITAAQEISGSDPANIVNKNSPGAGVQIEMSNALRASFFPNGDTSRAMRDSGARTATFYAYAAAILSVVPQVDCRFPGLEYGVAVDWDGDGLFTDVYEDVTADLLERVPITSTYGRDQARALSPTQAGEAEFDICNATNLYGPENQASPIVDDVLPGRAVLVQCTYNGASYAIHQGNISDLDVHTSRGDMSLHIGSVDAVARLRRVKLHTELYGSIRTGAAVHVILDAAGWPADRRDIDVGGTNMPWWWEEGTDAFEALLRLVNSEGPPSLAYVSPNGYFTFRDRHHRLIPDAPTQPPNVMVFDQGQFDVNTFGTSRGTSITPQAVYASGDGTGCGDTGSLPGLAFTEPFGYESGIKNIVNQVTFNVDERTPDGEPSVIFQTETPIPIADGEVKAIKIQAQDPFIQVIVPEADVDYVLQLGAVTMTTDRTSGQAVTLFIQATGGPAVLNSLQVRAYAVPVRGTYQVSVEDQTSINKYDVAAYPNDAPFAGVHDALAIAEIALGYWSERRPVVTIRIVNSDDAHMREILTREPSDRITVTHARLGLTAVDFHVEQKSHTVVRLGRIHAAVLGCEKAPIQAQNVARFDVGQFDVNTFGVQGLSDPANIFIFDRSQFDVGVFGY